MTIRLRLPSQAATLAAALLLAVAAVPLTAATARAADPVCLSGTLQYDYQSAEEGPDKPTRTKPVRYAGVELWGSEQAGDAPRRLNLDDKYTDQNGGFGLCHTPTTSTTMSAMWVRFATDVPRRWRVVDNSDELYTMDSPSLSDVSGSKNLGTLKAPASTARAWHAFDTVFSLWRNLNPLTGVCWTPHEPNYDNCTELTIRWADSDNGTHYDPPTNTVQLSGADPDSEHLVLHEAAHFLMHRLYDGTYPPVTNCWPHYIPKQSSATCAWSEGFADATAAYVLGDYRFVHNNGASTDFTHGNGWDVGDQVQGNVAGSLLDLWRRLDGGWDRTIIAVSSKQPSTFSDYFNTVRPAADLATGGTALAQLSQHAIHYGPTIVGDGNHHSLSNHGGLALERVGGCTTSSYANVVINVSDPSQSHQRWKLDENADGTVTITDGCPVPLALSSLGDSDNAVTLRRVRPDDAYQKWNVTRSDGTLRFTLPGTGRVLGTIGLHAGAAVTYREWSDANSRSWFPST